MILAIQISKRARLTPIFRKTEASDARLVSVLRGDWKEIGPAVFEAAGPRTYFCTVQVGGNSSTVAPTIVFYLIIYRRRQ